MAIAGVLKPAEQKIPDGHNLLKIAIFLLLLTGFFSAGQYGALEMENHWPGEAGSTVWLLKWAWLLATGALSSMVIIGLGILAHDAVHRVLFSRPWLNEWLGGFVSALALLPFHSNRQIHLTHHSYAHQPGKDPENHIHNHNFYVAVTAGALIALALHVKVMIENLLFRSFKARYLIRVAKDVILMTAAILTYFVLLPATGFDPLYTFVPMMLMLPVIFGFRAISDHYGLPALNRELGSESRPTQAEVDEWHKKNPPIQAEVTGWVILTNPLLKWLWSNVNYHEVHHKFPYLSYVYLEETFEKTRERLPYIVAEGYLHNLIMQRKRKYYADTVPETLQVTGKK